MSILENIIKKYNDKLVSKLLTKAQVQTQSAEEWFSEGVLHPTLLSEWIKKKGKND